MTMILEDILDPESMAIAMNALFQMNFGNRQKFYENDRNSDNVIDVTYEEVKDNEI